MSLLLVPLVVACKGSETEPVDLGSAVNYVILAKTGVVASPLGTQVRGDIGLSPAAAEAIEGFRLLIDSSGVFSTSVLALGRVFASDHAAPTPGRLKVAIADMEAAFSEAAGRAADTVELGDGDIGGMTMKPGVHKWGTALLIPDGILLAGSARDVWIFQVAHDLIVSGGASVMLRDGALPSNVFWQVGGRVDLGRTTHFEGVVLSLTEIHARTGASVKGRLFAQTAVTLDESNVSDP